MTTIPLQISDPELKKIDYLIKIGRYKNRSQALKLMLSEKLTQETISFDFENQEDDKVREKIVEELRAKKIEPIMMITSTKNSAELVSEDRDR